MIVALPDISAHHTPLNFLTTNLTVLVFDHDSSALYALTRLRTLLLLNKCPDVDGCKWLMNYGFCMEGLNLQRAPVYRFPHLQPG